MSVDQQLEAILKECDRDQLNKYLNDEEAIDLLVKSTSSYQAMLAEKESLQAQNKRLAQENMSKEPILESIKAKLMESLKDFETAKSDYQTKRDILSSIQTANGGDMSLDTILTRLQNAASRAEEETDKMSEEFFSSSMHSEEEINIFQKQYIEARTQAHIKKIKADKMKELMASNSVNF
jgi:ESCRT-I complex subunit VPS37